MKTIIFITSLLLCCGRLQAQANWLDSNVAILGPGAILPAGAQPLGDFKIKLGDAAQMESSYRRSLRAVTQQAIRLHGNLVFIQFRKPPGPFLPGWVIAGDIYGLTGPGAFLRLVEQERDSVLHTRAAAAANEVVVVCYRNHENSNIGAQVLVNDSSIGHLKPTAVIITRIPTNREVRFIAGRAQASRINISGKPGEVIFVKVRVNVDESHTLNLHGNGVAVYPREANTQISITEPRLGWQEAQALLAL